MEPAPARQRIFHRCTRITIDDIVSWIAWAEPWIRERVATTPRVQLVLGLLEESFPGCSWDLTRVRVHGDRPLLQTLADVDAKYFAKARAREPWPEGTVTEPHPLERAVAELVGGEAPPTMPPEFAHLGYHVDLEHTDAGWIWQAWRRGKHDRGVDLWGGPVPTWEAAVIVARTMIASNPG